MWVNLTTERIQRYALNSGYMATITTSVFYISADVKKTCMCLPLFLKMVFKIKKHGKHDSFVRC